MATTVTIATRFHGPPTSGNGGYTCGRLARFVSGPAEVTLRKPPPLDVPMTVEARGDGFALFDGEALVAEAVPTAVDVVPPAPVAVDVARAAASHSPVLEHPEWHPFPSCFVCGPERGPAEGLRLLPGRVDGTELFAVTWTPDASLASDGSIVDEEFVWAALDCPTSFVMYLGDTRPSEVRVLGRLAVRIDERPRTGESHVIVSWLEGHDGRKMFSADALYDADGRVLAFGAGHLDRALMRRWT